MGDIPWRNLTQFSGFNDPTYDPDRMETDEVTQPLPDGGPVPMDEEERAEVGVLVVDTNFFIDDRAFFCRLMELGSAFNLLIIVPFVVLQELDGLKERRELTLSMQQLHRYIAEGHRGIRGQRREQILREESVSFHRRLRSDRFAPKVEDDQILDCCLYFQHQFPYTLITLLTRDRLLITKALVHDIYHVDVSGLSPQDFLIHLADKASGREPIFTAPENPNKPLSAKQAGLHGLITEAMNYAENELSSLLANHFQRESPYSLEPWLAHVGASPPWNLYQISRIVIAAPKLSGLFTRQVLASFESIFSLTKTYHRLHEFGFEMFLPDVNSLMRHILNLFILFEAFDRPDILLARYTTVNRCSTRHGSPSNDFTRHPSPYDAFKTLKVTIGWVKFNANSKFIDPLTTHYEMVPF
ncbi:hypothetical protein L0F63_002538 [Massospora cicadina]|nr:hypothetical protein L0F63_002538 [Massospora cicadina]